MTWLESEPKQSAFRKATEWVTEKLPGVLVPEAVSDWASDHPRLQRAENTAIALGLLGAKARPAVPRLCELVGDQARSSVAARAAYALVCMGAEEALPVFAANLTNGHPYRRYFVRLIGNVPALTTNAAPAIPALLKCLQDADPAVSRAAAGTIGSVGFDPEIAIPALMDYLRGSRLDAQQQAALAALAHFGPNARERAPELLDWLSHSNRYVRWTATNTLRAIAPALLTNSTTH